MLIALVLLVVGTIMAPTAQAQGVDVDESDVAFITYEVEIALTDVEDFWDGDEHKTYRYGGVRVPPEARYFPDDFTSYIQKFPLANHPWSPGWVDDNVMWDRRTAVYVPPRLSGDSDHWDIATTCLDQEVFAAVNLNWGVGRREVAGDDWPDDYREWQEPQLRDTSYSGWGDGRSTLHVEVALVETDSFGGHGGTCRRARCSGYVSSSSYDCDGVKRVSGFAQKETTSSTNVHFPTQRPAAGQWVTGQLTTHKVTVELSGLGKAEVTVRAMVVRMRSGVQHAGVSLIGTAPAPSAGQPADEESAEEISNECTPGPGIVCGLAIEGTDTDEEPTIDTACVLYGDCAPVFECPFVDERHCHAFDDCDLSADGGCLVPVDDRTADSTGGDTGGEAGGHAEDTADGCDVEDESRCLPDDTTSVPSEPVEDEPVELVLIPWDVNLWQFRFPAYPPLR